MFSVSEADPALTTLIEEARAKMRMDAAWISEFVDGKQLLRAVASDNSFPEVTQGFSSNHAASYCKLVVDGELPAVIRNAREDSRTNQLSITDRLGIGSYVGVPIKRIDGSIFGMLCCIGRKPILTDPPVDQLEAIAVSAGLAVTQLFPAIETTEMKRARIEKTIGKRLVDMVYQPIVRLSKMDIVGVEALARFRHPPNRPDVWFADAAEVGMSEELELMCIASALVEMSSLPPDAYLSVNVSPRVACLPSFRQLVESADCSRLVIEITEQAAVPSYELLNSALLPLRQRGIRIAIDDAGAGYASFSHILALKPDIIKLDIHLTRGMDQDPARLSLAEAIATFANRVGALLVAEGVERQGELDCLLRIGSYAAQGYLLGRPGVLPMSPIAARPNTRKNSAQEHVEHQDFGDFVGEILKDMADETGLNVAYMTVLHPGIDMLEHRYIHSDRDIGLEPGTSVPWNDSVCKRCRDELIVWTPDFERDLAPGGFGSGRGIKTFVSMPLRTPANHSTLGTLCAVGFDSIYLSDPVIARVEGYSRLISDRILRDGLDNFYRPPSPTAAPEQH